MASSESDRFEEFPHPEVPVPDIFGEIKAAGRTPDPPSDGEYSTQTAATDSPKEERPRPTRPDPKIPSQLGPYELMEVIGHGASGIVYRAVHGPLRVERAVKVLCAGVLAPHKDLLRFRREATASARMGHHPNVVEVYDLGVDRGFPYYAMELVRGRPLSILLHRGAIGERRAASLGEQIARGAHFCHQHKVIHRDIKPANILLHEKDFFRDGWDEDLPEETARLTDFGLAIDRVASPEPLTSQDAVVGTIGYMSPEQERGESSDADARSDIYSIGAVVYEMLVGEPPPARQAVKGVPPPKRQWERTERDPWASRDLEAVCLKCLARDEALRYQTAEALAEDLSRARRGEPVRVRPAGRLERLARWWRRRRRPRPTLDTSPDPAWSGEEEAEDWEEEED